MNTSVTRVGFLALMLSTVTCLGQGSSNSADDPSSEQRAKLMRRRVATLRAVGSRGEAIAFSDDLLLRYRDLDRGIIDASLWSLGKAGRPQAILVLEVYDDDTLQVELTGTDDLPKSVEGEGWRWEPARTEPSWTAVAGPPPPKVTRAGRQGQIAAIARKFSADETWRGERIPLKLVPQAMDWYHDDKNAILDGAVYALAHGTNVEILVFIEARGSEDGPKWVAGFARLGAAALDVSYDGKAFWSQPASSGGRTRPYYFRSEALPDNGRLQR